MKWRCLPILAIIGLTVGASVASAQPGVFGKEDLIKYTPDWKGERFPDGRPRVERVIVSEPIEGGERRSLPPLQLGGTRHISAAQFAQDQHDALALVASQDGRFTVFAWSARDEAVRAHRVEALLL